MSEHASRIDLHAAFHRYLPSEPSKYQPKLLCQARTSRNLLKNNPVCFVNVIVKWKPWKRCRNMIWSSWEWFSLLSFTRNLETRADILVDSAFSRSVQAQISIKYQNTHPPLSQSMQLLTCPFNQVLSRSSLCLQLFHHLVPQWHGSGPRFFSFHGGHCRAHLWGLGSLVNLSQVLKT